MDFSSQTITGLSTLLFLFVLWRSLARKSKSKNINVPEPTGAWPLIGHFHLLARQEPACRILGDIADKTGPLYSLRLGINRIMVASGWEVVKECFTTNDRIFATRASIAAGKYIGYNNAIFALAPYGQYWRDVRKLATLKLLSSNRLEKLKHVRLSEVDTFLKDLHNLYVESADSNHAKVIINTLFERLTFNISLRMIVGKQFSSSTYGEENSEPWRYKKAIEEAVYLSGTFVMSDAIPWLEWIDHQGHISAMKRTAKELDAVIETWLEEHIKKRSSDECHKGENDFMDVMLSDLDEDAVMSGHSRDTVIKATAMILTLTGSGSTAVTLTWALSLLLNNPGVLKAAQEELDIHVGREKWVQESDIENLKYLQAIVKETLRLYPPGPLTGIREASEDCNLGGYFVPKGTRLIINIWQLQRDPRVWKDPGEFQPERFLTTHSDVDFRGQNFEFIPFSSGRRSCPAITFGLQVVHLTLARVLQGFDLTTIGGLPVDMTEGLGIALPKVNPVEVIIKPRLGLELYQCL
ncbi:dimethylnonatriene synthase [Ricinus communis]|uniref:Cytochrome P450, putative n=1 Tax=Ricinus communis TaxID=3988 RepID=B9SYM4_RICCO|nr:dimethylnonatriene synthase [Ricinus communis]EEF31307.1 cytochrome P450, putative [Ricinus communis]